MPLSEALTSEWHALAELVTAAVLVAVVYPTSQSIYRRLTRQTNISTTSTPDYAYAASTLVRPGHVSTLRYGDETQAEVMNTNAIPTILRKFQDMSLSDNDPPSNLSASNFPASPEGAGITVTSPSPRSSANKKGGLDRAHSVHFDTPSTNAADNPALLSPPSISSPGVWSPLVAPAVAPPPPSPIKSESIFSAAKTSSTRAATAPPSELPSSTPENVHTTTPAAAITAPVPKSKTKGKQKVQSQPSPPSRATSTPPAVPSPRPKTRSMSAAPSLPASASGSGSDGDAMDVDEPAVGSYIRHSTSRASWFESTSDDLLAHPPDFTPRSDVQLEDIFIHRGKQTYQCWIWESVNGGRPGWKRVWIGYPRPSDGKVLSVTPTRKEPSWVSERWAAKTAKKRAA